MKIPNKVKIANHVYKIKEWDREVSILANRFGECDCNTLEIKIDTGYDHSIVTETLLHEILHAIFWSYNIKDDDNEERTITTLATGLSLMFKENKEVYEFLKYDYDDLKTRFKKNEDVCD